MARNFPSADTLKAETGSRVTCFEAILFQDRVFHDTIFPPLPKLTISSKVHESVHQDVHIWKIIR